MKTIPHPQHSRNLGAPLGWDHTKVHCGSLSIHDTNVGGYKAMESAWVPEENEALMLALGFADIRLAVIGQTHPPVSMLLMPKLGITQEVRIKALLDHMDELGKYAAQCGLALELKFDPNLGHTAVVLTDPPKSTGSF
jgi:hypothetical protein